MRIVYVIPFSPYPMTSGAQRRIWQTLQALARWHDIDLVVQSPPLSDADVRPLRRMVRSITFTPPSARAQVPNSMWGKRWATVVDTLSYPPSYCQRFATAELTSTVQALLQTRPTPDWLLCDTQLSGTVLLAANLPHVRTAICLFDLYETVQRRKLEATPRGMFHLKIALDWLKARHYENQLMGAADLVIAVSESDRRMIASRVHSPMTITVPNGVDTRFFAPRHQTTYLTIPQPIALFVGTLWYEPNSDGVRYFLDDIWPQVRQSVPDAQFHIVGQGPPAWLTERAAVDPSLVVHGLVKDVRPLYHSARVAVVPIRLGAGTKLKLLEALAMGTPVVTTRQGIMGTLAQHGRHVLVGTTPTQFAAHVIALLSHADAGRQLAAEGRSLVEAHYSWSSIMATLNNQLRQHARPPRRTRHYLTAASLANTGTDGAGQKG